MCGNITGTYEFRDCVEAGTGIAVCPHCLCQAKVLASSLVNAWKVCKQSEGEDEYRFDDPDLTVIGSRRYMIMAEKDDFIDDVSPTSADSPRSDYI
jgi:hypothetical protein